jgi:hypothetical protein
MNRAADKLDLVNNLHRLFAPDSIGIFTEELVALWNGQRTLRIEGRTVRLDGAAAEVIMHLRVPEIAGQPDFEHVVVIILDVTDQKRLEQFRRPAGRPTGRIAHNLTDQSGPRLVLKRRAQVGHPQVAASDAGYAADLAMPPSAQFARRPRRSRRRRHGLALLTPLSPEDRRSIA